MLSPIFMRWIVAAFLAGVLLATAIEALNRGLADIYYDPIKKSINVPGWPATRKPLPLEKALGLISNATRWDPNNPDVLRAQTRLWDKQAEAYKQDRYFWQAEDPRVREANLQALAQSRLGLMVRPSSPWLWNEVALMKAKLGEFDEMMQASLRRASELGPMQPRVQTQIAETGLSTWSKLNQETRVSVLETIARAMPGNGRYVLKIAEKHNQLPLLCEIPHIRQHISQICGQI